MEKEVSAKDAITALEDNTFTPADLLCVTQVLADEISQCQGLLKDELEKRRKYKVCLWIWRENLYFLYMKWIVS